MIDENKIRQLVRSSKIKQAIKILIDSDDREYVDTGIILMARYNSLEKSNRMNIITYDNYNKSRNKLSFDILSFFSDSDYDTDYDDDTDFQTNNTFNMELELIDIIRKNKRKANRTKLVKDARNLLKLYQDYTTDKKLDRTYDKSGSKFEKINNAFSDIKLRLRNLNNESLDDIVDKVKQYLPDSNLNYSDLTKAYELCIGRGMSDPFIEKVLKNQPDDEDAKIKVAEKMEEFLEII